MEVTLKRARSLRTLASVFAAMTCSAAFGQITSPSASEPDVSRSPANSRAPSPPTRAPSIVVAPNTFAMAEDFANGCWVRLYDGRDFVGQQLTLVGPLSLSEMTLISPSWRRWNSAVVGPHARLTIYGGKDFERRSTRMSARQRASDLASKDVDWYGKIESARVECTRP
ncbi:MAG TPA: hypothetical protein VLC09_11255 [Polyangiaceae bacterium]|nr:hypothetical protein [Polyangiaceae bacterium]